MAEIEEKPAYPAWFKYALGIVGATMLGIVAVAGIIFWMSGAFVSAQLDKIDHTATAVKDSVEVVVEKGDAAKEKVTSFIDAVKDKLKGEPSNE